MPMLAEANSRWPATENGAANASWMRAATRKASRVSARLRQHHRTLVAPERGQGDVAGLAFPDVGRPDAGDEIALAQRPRDPAQRLAQQQVADVVAELHR